MIFNVQVFVYALKKKIQVNGVAGFGGLNYYYFNYLV
jgi:hypothetical protein